MGKVRWIGLVVVIGGLFVGLGLVLHLPPFGSDSLEPIEPTGGRVDAAEAYRRAANAVVRDIELTAAPATIELDGSALETWAFNGQVPGPEIRLTAGEVLRARVRNDLPQPLTIHWHGIAIRNDMDGVPDLTQEAIPPGGEFIYEFTAPDPGTYFYHPHTGTQLDTGLYAPLIVEDPAEFSGYDLDVPVLLDDWIDGTGDSPDEILERLQGGGSAMEDMESDESKGMDSMEGMHGDEQTPPASGEGTMREGEEEAAETGAAEGPLGDDTGDVDYPFYLINGRAPADPAVFEARPGDRVRLRIINAGSDTPFRVAVGGLPLTVIATDGFSVEPVTVDSILVGMGERYDVAVSIPDEGAFPLVAQAEGKGGRALAVLDSGTGDLPMPDVSVPELQRRLLTLDDLVATDAVSLPPGEPDRTYRVGLTGTMARYNWALTGTEEDGVTLPVREGERVRLVFANETAMWHPLHLHGQTFQVVREDRTLGARKDTVIVPAQGRVTVEFLADNPGQWALHCHNIYHAEAGMVIALTYVS